MHIYKITNCVNSKVYIGQTIQKNPKMRWYSHLGDARDGKPGHLYESIRKYGPNQFNWEIIDEADSLEKLNQLETKWIAHYRSLVECYNHRDGGGNSLHSELSKKRMSEAQKAAHARRRANGSNTHKEHKKHVWTAEHPKKGKKHVNGWSSEAKEKFSLQCKERNQVNNFYKNSKEN
jgi:group I intron endonuclease